MSKEKSLSRIFFIKPFEVLASYILFARTWNIVKENYINTDDVLFANLMKAFDDKAKYGYVSMSEWKSKEAFKKSLLKNSIFKFHHSANRNSTSSGIRNLYKIIAEELTIKIKSKNKISLMVFIEDNFESKIKIHKVWESLVELFNMRNTLLDSSVYKSINSKNIISYVIMFNFDLRCNKENIINIVDNYFRVQKLNFKYFISLYKFESIINKNINLK